MSDLGHEEFATNSDRALHGEVVANRERVAQQLEQVAQRVRLGTVCLPCIKAAIVFP